MVFSSADFLWLFLPITFLLYFNPFIKSILYRNCVLLIVSILFYAWGEPTFSIIMICSVIIDWGIGLQVGKCHNVQTKKVWMILATSFHIGLLFVFKYMTFVTSQLSLFFPIKIVTIALPIGISFFTFQMMSYIFDIYYRKVSPQTNVLKLGLYITMFPQLIAGPIVRYQTIVNEIDNRSVRLNDVYEGINRFIVGFLKKVLLADLLAVVSNNIFSASSAISIASLSAWIGAIAFSFEIYFDFSGYSDMAIGLARCFGFHFNENFNYPYIATSVTEFWKRWHISLTNWFRDYVYIPLGGNRVGKIRNIINLSVVWLLTGIWHGANWTFIVWGFVFLLCQVFEKCCGKLYFKVPSGIRWVITMTIVCCNWVIFKSDSLSSAVHYIGIMFGYGANYIDDTAVYYSRQCFRLILISALAALPWRKVIIWIMEVVSIKEKNNEGIRKLFYVVKDMTLFMLFVVAVARVINGAYSPFIYFNF